MRISIVAALALAVPSSLSAQAADFSTATPINGTWAYAANATGSEATFADASGNPQFRDGVRGESCEGTSPNHWNV